MNKFFKKIIFVKLLAIIFFFFSANCARNKLRKITSQLEDLSLAENNSLFAELELNDDLLSIIKSQDPQEAINLGKVCKRWNKIFKRTIQPTIVDFTKHNSEITDKYVESFVKNKPYLRFINLGGCNNITDDSVIAIAKYCLLLQNLNLSYCCNLTDDAIITIAENCPNLRCINLAGLSNIKIFALNSLASKCRTLKKIYIEGPINVTKAALGSFIRKNSHIKVQRCR